MSCPILISFDGQPHSISLDVDAVWAEPDKRLYVTSDSVVLRVACLSPCEAVEAIHDALSDAAGPHDRKITLALRDVETPLKVADTLSGAAELSGRELSSLFGIDR